MPLRRKLIRQILIVLRNLDDDSPKLSAIEFVKNDKGEIVGYKLEIKSDKKEEGPKLSLVHGKKAATPS